jgi:hypothetical protein
MNAEEREVIRRVVVRFSIDGREDFGQVAGRLVPKLPGRSFREILNHVDRIWRREKKLLG